MPQQLKTGCATIWQVMGDIPEQERNGLIEALQHLVQDQLVLVLGARDEEHKVPDEFVDHHNLIEHRDLRCKGTGSLSTG